jgi:hypothetical protein
MGTYPSDSGMVNIKINVKEAILAKVSPKHVDRPISMLRWGIPL